MLRKTPVWLLAALPAALFGHLFAYLAQGRTVSDAPHRYFNGALELAAGVVLLAAVAAAVDAVLRARRDLQIPAFVPLWMTLAASQLLIFSALERMEGNTPALVGCAVQIFVALLTAALVRVLFELVGGLARVVLQSRYSGRAPTRWVCAPAAPVARGAALRVCLGASGFQRPPPLFA